MDPNKYTLNGKYTYMARKLNPYSSPASTNLFRQISDMYSYELANKEKGYTFRDLAVLALNFTDGRDFYSGEQIITEDKIIVPEELIQRDHLFPASKGGLYAYGNVVITMQSCNIEKSDINPYDYYQYRFDNHLPTLYKTMDEAYSAITFLHTKFTECYPNATNFIEEFNKFEMPFTWREFSSKIELWVKDNSNVKFVKRNTGKHESLEFAANLKDINFWMELNDLESRIYKNYSSLTIKDVVGSRLVHVSDLFAEKNKSIINTPPREINRMITEFISDKSRNEKNKYNLIRRTIIRYRKSYRDYQKQKQNA